MERDIRKVLETIKKGKFETESFYDLLMEIRDNERDEALLSLITKMFREVK